MKLHISNNNLYYSNYKIFDNRLSLILVPAAFFILWHERYIKYFSYIFIFIATVGVIDTIILMMKYNLLLFFLVIIILHLILLYPLSNCNKYLKPNSSNYFLGILAYFCIKFYPNWPYTLSKNTFIIILIIVYTLLTILGL